MTGAQQAAARPDAAGAVRRGNPGLTALIVTAASGLGIGIIALLTAWAMATGYFEQVTAPGFATGDASPAQVKAALWVGGVLCALGVIAALLAVAVWAVLHDLARRPGER